MTHDELQKEISQLFIDARQVLSAKNADYSDGDDALSNFKVVARATGVTKYIVWAVYAWKHFAALLAFARAGRVESEPIRGRVIDSMVYPALLWGLYCEDHPEAKRAQQISDVSPNGHVRY